MLEARSLAKYYSHTAAVRGVSFSIKPGEVLGYLGPNGAGKSTTVKMLTGLIEPSEGQIFYRGRTVYDDFPAFQRQIGYVPEEAHLYPHLSGWEYLQLVGRLRSIPRQVLEPKIEEFFHLFSLWDDRHDLLSSYSKGMRQKVLLSAALLHNPEILILDEPFSGLDVTSSMVLRSLIRNLAEQGKMILYSSHVLEVVEKVCSQVLILRKGEVVAYDSIGHLRDLMSQPSLEGVFAQLAQGKTVMRWRAASCTRWVMGRRRPPYCLRQKNRRQFKQPVGAPCPISPTSRRTSNTRRVCWPGPQASPPSL
jgi:ABC-2 type transport system ATP-binding protein